MNREFILAKVRCEVARRSFYEFCRFYDPKFFSDDKPHLKLIADSFQRIASGEIRRLMISLPPRAGKSYITSLFCAWLLGTHPTESIMRNSYSMEIASKFSYDVRNVIVSRKFREVFPTVELKTDRMGIADWALKSAKQSSYFCAGVGGSITGKGCSLLAVLDDPIKNIEDALSETILEKTWAWYTSTHLARMESGCAEIQIATRWSRKDVIGRLCDIQEGSVQSISLQLASSLLDGSQLGNSQSISPQSYSQQLGSQESQGLQGDGWYQIVIPALNDAGESFCAAIKTTVEYNEIRRINDAYIWSAEYMQEPVEKAGILFELNELQRFDEAKGFDGIAGYCDTADTGKDFLCAVVGGIKDRKIYVLDALMSQDGMEVTEKLLAEMIINTKCKVMTIESNSAGKVFARNVKRILTEAGWLCDVRSIFNSKNKETRILMNSGIVKSECLFRRGYASGSGYDVFMRQLTGYVKQGRNRNDDAPDALTGLVEVAENFKQPIKVYSRRVRKFSKVLKGFM